MEKKTIGGFISALRKANGLTQKQLAEKLNVSDKAISRWERDEAMPDLSLIPELAEIFGVTTDEILRGERRNPESTEQPSREKSEKQRKRILADKKTKYQIRSTISIGIAVVGLIAAMICNFGFLRAYIGFMMGTVFYAAAAICQVIFIFLNLSGLDEDLVTEDEQITHRDHTAKLAYLVFGVIIVLLDASLPLVIFPFDTYQGVTAGQWALSGALCAAVSIVLCRIASCIINVILTKKGFLRPDGRRKAVQALQMRFIGIGALVLAVLFFGQLMVNSFLPNALRQGVHFSDWDSFKAYMETPVEPEEYTAYQNGITFGVDNTAIEEAAPPSDSVYYDEYGNILEEEPINKIYADDGTLLCEYYHRNESISSITYTKDAENPQITIYTTSEIRRVNVVMADLVNPIYVCMYPLSMLIVYLINREKAKKI